MNVQRQFVSMFSFMVSPRTTNFGVKNIYTDISGNGYFSQVVSICLCQISLLAVMKFFLQIISCGCNIKETRFLFTQPGHFP